MNCKVCSKAVLKIVDGRWDMTRMEFDQSVQNIVKEIVLSGKAQARLEAKGIFD